MTKTLVEDDDIDEVGPVRVIVDFIKAELVNQNFIPGTPEFDQRLEWMWEAWQWAEVNDADRPTLEVMLELGRLVEPEKNADGIRTVGVIVGGRVCPNPPLVPHLLYNLWLDMEMLEPIDFYKRFEEIHPFVDGNGRVGKILYNWLLDQLEAPQMPPRLWEHGPI